MKNKKSAGIIKDYIVITLAIALMAVGIYFFRFPNNFTFGGVTGIAVIVSKLLPVSAGTATLIMNIILLIVGFIFLGRDFGAKTAYASLLCSLMLSGMEIVFPMNGPLTDEPLLELIFAVTVPAVSSAIIFNLGATSGGTEIVAMIFKKRTTMDIAHALVYVDCITAIATFFVFDVKTGLFSVCGLFAKSFVVDGVIENMNRCKCFTIICDDVQPICDFIMNKLKRSATVLDGKGAFKGEERSVILSIMNPHQAVLLRNYLKKEQPNAFLSITNSSEIIGKGFHGFS